MTSVHGGRREARAEAKRTQIVGGAQRLFLAQGYAAASTDAIAAEAGVSKQTLYAYFPSKEELLVAVLRRLISPASPDELMLFGLDQSPADRVALRRVLIDLAERMIAAVMQSAYLALLRVIIAEAPRQPHLADLYRATVPERGLLAVTSLLARAAENGVVVIADLDAAARLFIGALLTYALLDGLFVVDGPPRPPSSERIEAIVDLFLRAVA